MAESTRLLRRRLKSIAATRKVTRAMELVSAAKMRKASQAALATRPFARTAWSLVEHVVSGEHATTHPLLAQRPVHHSIIVVMAADRGLVGGLNAQLARRVLQVPTEGDTQYVAVGRRAEDLLRRAGKPMVAAFPGATDRPTPDVIRALAKLTLEAFRSGEVDRVQLVYPDFVSMLRQVPRVKNLLPLEPASIRAFLAETGAERERSKAPPELFHGFTFEPATDQVLDAVLPRLVEVQIRQALHEASASEHAARMVAMRSATDAAGELGDALSLAFNQTRQAAITKDLTEIAASRTALEE